MLQILMVEDSGLSVASDLTVARSTPVHIRSFAQKKPPLQHGTHEMLKRKIKPPSTRWVDLEPRSKVKTAVKRPMRQVGISHGARERRRWTKELNKWFLTLGIYSCEVKHKDCLGGWLCGLAHSRKRRKIENKEQFFEVVLACVKCHEWLDNILSHEEMEAKVKEIIAKRNI